MDIKLKANISEGRFYYELLFEGKQYTGSRLVDFPFLGMYCDMIEAIQLSVSEANEESAKRKKVKEKKEE